MAVNESDRVMLEMTLRQLAPHIKNFLETFAVKWNVSFYDCYLIGRYAPNLPLDDPKSTILEVSSYSNSKLAERVFNENAQGMKQGTSEFELLKQMFPLFREEFEVCAKEWKVPITDVYLTLSYIKGKDTSTADSTQIELHERTGKNKGKIVQ